MHVRLRKARHRSRVICLCNFVGCPSFLYVVVGAYPINMVSDIIFSCAYSPVEVVHILHNSSCTSYLRNKVAQKYGFEPVCMRLTCRPSTLKMMNNSTKRNNIKRRIKAIYYWYNTRSSGRIKFVLQLF